MDVPISEGLVTLNAEGKRYTDSFRIERGVITVASATVSTSVELLDVISPQSIARTVVRPLGSPAGVLTRIIGKVCEDDHVER